MTNKRKKQLIGIVVSVILIMLACVGRYVYKESQRFARLPYHPNPRIESIAWMGLGTVTGEDTCLIIDEEAGTPYYHLYFDTIPGKYVFLTETEGLMEKMEGKVPRKKFYWKRIEIRIYDIDSGSQIKNIDIKKLIEEQAPGYQYDGWGEQVFIGKNGHAYIRWMLSDVPEDGNQEGITKYLCVDCETGETHVVDNITRLYDNGGTRQAEFKEKFYDGSWAAFMEKNKLTAFDEEDGRAFEYIPYSFVNGVANIDIETTALPKENEALYARFPGLQAYQGEEGKIARIFLGGYSTAKEVQQLFAEEAVE